MVSTDAGQTFAPLADAPALLLVDTLETDAGGGLVGVDPSGGVWRLDAEKWTQTGTTSSTPEAFTVVSGTTPWILVANANGIAASDDYGNTWTSLAD
jgi:hypothetical protein